ncbi:hypothetical protein DDE82_004639 [Stemphylium lycopersici]|nr:hypothetical protein DDE82_004639 [Stemphylium lycopersici]
MTSAVRLREAQPSDEPAIVEVCTRAFFDEDLFGRIIHPHRASYPDDVQIFWHNFIRHDWSSPHKQQQEQVIGAAIWLRQGTDTGAEQIQKQWSDPTPHWPSFDSTRVNCALDPSKANILKDSAPYTAHYWADSLASNWYLALCGVDPAFSRRGVGRLLVKWGLDQAREEGVAASVISSEGSNPFYLTCGFDAVVGNASEGEGNPMAEAGVKGGDILFMWAREGEVKG